MIIIGISGEKGSGKDAVADVFVKMAVCDSFKISLADKVKEVAMDLFFLTHDDVYTQEGKERYIPHIGKTVREILQFLGTEVGRAIWGEVWVEHMKRKVHELVAEHGEDILVVVPDCRFGNELRAIRDWDGYNVCINRPRDISGGDDHASENDFKSYNGWDYIIDNVDDLETLRSKALTILSSICKIDLDKGVAHVRSCKC